MTALLVRTLLVTALLGLASPAAAADPQSPALAKKLADTLSQHKMEAIAARDPANPARFIAALYIPQSELLVVAAEFSEPSVFNGLLANRQYRDVYVDLQASPIRLQPVFVQDLGADGLCSESSQLPDTVQENGKTQTVFDGDWHKHKVSRDVYEQQYQAADAQYSHMLTVLLTAVQAPQ